MVRRITTSLRVIHEIVRTLRTLMLWKQGYACEQGFVRMSCFCGTLFHPRSVKYERARQKAQKDPKP